MTVDHDTSAAALACVVTNDYFLPAVTTCEMRATKFPVVVNAFTATLRGSSLSVE